MCYVTNIQYLYHILWPTMTIKRFSLTLWVGIRWKCIMFIIKLLSFSLFYHLTNVLMTRSFTSHVFFIWYKLRHTQLKPECSETSCSIPRPPSLLFNKNTQQDHRRHMIVSLQNKSPSSYFYFLRFFLSFLTSYIFYLLLWILGVSFLPCPTASEQIFN